MIMFQVVKIIFMKLQHQLFLKLVGYTNFK
jgi:hypothetical protein